MFLKDSAVFIDFIATSKRFISADLVYLRPHLCEKDSAYLFSRASDFSVSAYTVAEFNLHETLQIVQFVLIDLLATWFGPSFSVNAIGDYKNSKGYLAYFSEDVSLTWVGELLSSDFSI